jgi:hypothetical protein
MASHPAAAYAAEHGIDRLYAADLAALAGPPGRPLTPGTMARYKAVAAANRAAGRPGPRDLPEPDGHDPVPAGGVPLAWWRPATADAWLAARQRGAGRPPAVGGHPAVRTPPEERATPGPKPGTPGLSPGRPRHQPDPVTEENPVDIHHRPEGR